eukprot:7198465-Heterocapsa_arctica.AAC.1
MAGQAAPTDPTRLPLQRRYGAPRVGLGPPFAEMMMRIRALPPNEASLLARLLPSPLLGTMAPSRTTTTSLH